ncbi:T-cell activation inhibitor, mitochondrial [Periophthalmus magnuspinnatus]|uniref:T-cell activation inhibitor, mitochondrial n=1 Tax=Periophthalmus magnuspinnatus TaxID=409849 RepID=UPI0024363930|nr:T-cell activation inhibitor, mitochondrial [Periophthalmus magnuspinnatus]
MFVYSALRCVIRVKKRHVATGLVQQRALSGAEAVNALRPFYFAVHPDFFGKHPKEREVNENSLKRLNGYLETLQRPGVRSVQPMKLTFYIRDTKDGDEPDLMAGFRPVTFTLYSNDVQSAVINVLRSCSLPHEHMKTQSTQRTSPQGTGPQGAQPFYRPIKWDKSYYSFTGFRDPEQELQQAKRVEPTLGLWLRKNEPEATKKHKASVPRRDELERLKTELCLKFNLTDLRWQRSWGVSHRYCQLQSLSRLSLQSPDALIPLQGHTVVFADESGMNASGHVMLGTMDVHHQWLKLMERVPRLRGLQQQSQWLKERISLLLGGAVVLLPDRMGSEQPIAEHYSSLNAFHKRLLSDCMRVHPRSLEGLGLVIDNNRSMPSLHELGHFLIPVTSDPAKLPSFLQSHAPEARRRTQHHLQLKREEERVTQQCLSSLSLHTLSKESSISSVQMSLCCGRLLDLRPPLLQGLDLRVSRYYSVLQDGDVCVPWDWNY